MSITPDQFRYLIAESRRPAFMQKTCLYIVDKGQHIDQQIRQGTWASMPGRKDVADVFDEELAMWYDQENDCLIRG